MKFKPENFTYGYEIEWGDIDKSIEIPKHLGAWEYCECDIVNVHPPYRGIAVDPLGLNVPMGGEINVKPTNTVEEMVDRIMEIHQIFVDAGNKPSDSCVNHGHVHVRVPGLRDDIDALKKFMRYYKEWQNVHHHLYDWPFQDKELVEQIKKDGLTSYIKLDGGRSMPDWMVDNILEKAENFDDFIRIHACGKDGVSRGRPFRYAINTYNLKHTDTIEFRCYRSSTDRDEIRNSILFAKNFIDAALNNQQDPREFLNGPFPKLDYNSELAQGWKKTKYKSDATKKRRRLHEVI